VAENELLGAGATAVGDFNGKIRFLLCGCSRDVQALPRRDVMNGLEIDIPLLHMPDLCWVIGVARLQAH
jgi:hypothetical protein